MTKDKDKIQINLAMIENHFHFESEAQIDKVIETYTDDIIWEAPARNLTLQGKSACAEHYRKIIAGIGQIYDLVQLDRYATEDRVFDDRIITFQALNDNVWNIIPEKIVNFRLIHTFHMRGGLICKEIGYEIWRIL